MKRIFFSLLLALALQMGVKAQTTPAFWPDILAFKKQDSTKPVPSNSILFVGSSSFTRWTDVNDYFPGYPIVNRGFGGSTLVDVIRYAYDVIIPYHPKQVLIYGGDNDLAFSESVTPQDILTRFKTLFSIIRINLPATQIDFVSIKPSPSRIKLFSKAKEANALVKDFLKKQKNAGFINVFDALLDASGKPIESLYVQDRLHLKPEGYRIWQKIIQPYLLK
jgi:lysophospholipase L1-like esterase